MKLDVLPAMAVALSSLLCSTAATAEPFEIYARYDPLDAKTGCSPVSIVVTPDAVLPRQTETHKLNGLYLRARKDDVSRTSLTDYRNFSYVFRCQSKSCGGPEHPFDPGRGRVTVPADPATIDKLIVKAERVPGSDHVDRLTLRVRAKLTPQYLCGQEMAMRNAGKPDDGWSLGLITPAVLPEKDTAKGAAPKPREASGEELKKASPAAFSAIGILRRKVGDEKAPIFYSFCKPVADAVHWARLVSPGPAGETREGAEARADKMKNEQKRALGKLIVAELRETHKIETAGVGSDGERSDGSALPENVFVQTDLPFSILREPKELLSYVEVDRSDPRPLQHTMSVSQGSKLRMIRARDFCRQLPAACDAFVKSNLSLTMEGPDKDGKTAVRDVAMSLDDTGWLLDVPLKDFLLKTVTLKLWYKNGDAKFLVRQDSFSVEDFGLVQTPFPIVTDLISLAKRGGQSDINPNDLSYQSSIPISWAFNATANDGRHVAVTLPWMFGYNPRSAPRLADYVRVFAHMSLVLPLGADAGTGATTATGAQAADKPRAQVAFGTGLFFVNSFSFAWGMTTDVGAHYVMLGISPPDLVKAFR